MIPILKRLLFVIGIVPVMLFALFVGLIAILFLLACTPVAIGAWILKNGDSDLFLWWNLEWKDHGWSASLNTHEWLPSRCMNHVADGFVNFCGVDWS